MIKKITLVLLLTPILVFAQSHKFELPENLIERQAKGYYNSSIEYIRDSLPHVVNVELQQQLEFELGKLYSVNYNIDSAFVYLFKSVDIHEDIQMLSDPNFLPLTNFDLWSDLCDTVFSVQNIKFKSAKHKEITKKFIKIEIYDQALFQHIDVMEDLNLGDNIINYALHTFKDKLSEENEKELVEIINEVGWPKNKDYPLDTDFIIFVVTQHGELNFIESIFPTIEGAYKEGSFPAQTYAYLKDRICLWKNIPQVYGTQIGTDDNGKHFLYKTDDIEHVDERRSSVGLGGIKEYLESWGIKK